MTTKSYRKLMWQVKSDSNGHTYVKIANAMSTTDWTGNYLPVIDNPSKQTCSIGLWKPSQRTDWIGNQLNYILK